MVSEMDHGLLNSFSGRERGCKGSHRSNGFSRYLASEAPNLIIAFSHNVENFSPDLHTKEKIDE